MQCNRRLFSTGSLLLGLTLALTSPALAADEHNTTSGLTAAGAPLALHGYDAVSFFTDSAAQEGSAQFSAVHDGATFYFTSQKNLDSFKADPAHYAPAFGGFCAYGVSVGKKFDGDPRFWTVSGNKLYVNLNGEISKKFKEDVAGSIAKAETQWKTIEHKPVGSL
jgi:YHS domain-containing protein